VAGFAAIRRRRFTGTRGWPAT